MRILVAHTKGGVGKTTTAVHLAAALHEHRASVLVDLDTNPAALDYASHQRLPMQVLGIREGREALEQHDTHVVIDAPARPGDDQLLAFAGSVDLVVIPTPPADLALRALRRMIGTLSSSSTPHRVLLTLVPPHPSDLGTWARDTLERAGVPLFTASIPRRIAFEHATNAGQLVRDVRNGRNPWEAYQAVAVEVLQHE